MQIAYLDGPRLRRATVAACRHAQRLKAELNRINVFPVPDGDTGTNLALTTRAIMSGVAGSEDRAVSDVARSVAEAAVLGARGNCGMMLSHFLLGFANDLGERHRVTTQEFASALSSGAQSLETAIERPVEGTILTVIRDTATAARESASSDFAHLMQTLVERARASLARTTDLLPVLREAGVVDAGAKGFVTMLEGVQAYIRGEVLYVEDIEDDVGASPVALTDYPDDGGQYRFCTEALVEGSDLPAESVVRDALREDSEELIVIRTGSILKVHLHTDDPEGAFDYLRTLGTLVSHKAEDMWVQHEASRRSGHTTVRRPVGVVTDSSCDLPDPVVRAHGMGVVPLLLVDGDDVLLDRVEISAEEFHRKLGTAEALPTTSQPPPGTFVEAFREASTESEEIVAVLLGSALSGTYGSAEAAIKLMSDASVTLVDSRGASLLTGLLALKAAELAEAGESPDDIAREVARIRDQSNILFTVDTFDRLLASGRVSKVRALFGGLLDLKPVLGLTPEGTVAAMGKARGRERVRALVLDLIVKAVPVGSKVRFGLVDVGANDVMEAMEAELRQRYGDVDITRAPATPVIATHIGIGAWGVAYILED